MKKFGRLLFSVLVAGAACWTTAALAQFPNRTVTFVVPAAAGGGNDIVAREIATFLQKKWGQPVIVLDKPGAGVSIAEGYVANAAPNGYTILIDNQTRTINAAIGGSSSGYDMVNGFAPITEISKQPFILAANKDLAAKTLPELVALAKASPNKITYGDSGRGTGGDLAMKRLMQKTGSKFFEIPFKANAEILIAMMGGEVDVELGDVLTTTPHVKAGQVRALAVADDVRNPALPDVPTIAEALGFDSFVYNSWYGVYAPAGTPKDVVKQLNDDIVAVVRLPDIRDRLIRDGSKVVASSPEDFEKFLNDDTAVWRGVLEGLRSK